MAAIEGTVAEFSGFTNFEERKGKSNFLMSFPIIVNQMGSFGEKRKKIFFSLLSADSRYFRIYALNHLTNSFVSLTEERFSEHQNSVLQNTLSS